MKIKEGYLFFWGNEDYMSNWHKASFEIDGISFNCSEQYMMYAKAITFNDFDTANKILRTSSQSAQKKLGREVKNYDDSTWTKVRMDVVYKACLAKFEQNPALKEQLLNTNDLHLVEASPYDKIWGIGLDENAPEATNSTLWRGLNLLGEVLMKVRSDLKEQK